MLVLTRKLGETIQVGEDVCLTVLKIKGNTVRIGIEAPATVQVKRGELPPRPARTEITLVMECKSTEGHESENGGRLPQHATWKSVPGQSLRQLDRSGPRGTEPLSRQERQRAGTEMTRLREIVDRVTHTPLKTLARAIGTS